MRGVGVAVPESSADACGKDCWFVRGVGSITFVRFGRGEAGREGGSWVGAGVEVDILGGSGVRGFEREGGEVWWRTWRRVVGGRGGGRVDWLNLQRVFGLVKCSAFRYLQVE